MHFKRLEFASGQENRASWRAEKGKKVDCRQVPHKGSTLCSLKTSRCLRHSKGTTRHDIYGSLDRHLASAVINTFCACSPNSTATMNHARCKLVQITSAHSSLGCSSFRKARCGRIMVLICNLFREITFKVSRVAQWHASNIIQYESTYTRVNLSTECFVSGPQPGMEDYKTTCSAELEYESGRRCGSRAQMIPQSSIGA